MHMHVRAYVDAGGADIGCLPQSVSTLDVKAGSLTWTQCSPFQLVWRVRLLSESRLCPWSTRV